MEEELIDVSLIIPFGGTSASQDKEPNDRQYFCDKLHFPPDVRYTGVNGYRYKDKVLPIIVVFPYRFLFAISSY